MATLRQQNEALNKLWKIYRKNIEIHHLSQEDYDNLITETGKVYEDSGQDRLVNDLCCVFIGAIERQDV